ncbi:hypothetical protein SZ55_4858 [Pseudomonas sp. FeS53a]|nr:hypothetical protein SZ55_4858 [Pseudomonas sp. FeS53a]
MPGGSLLPIAEVVHAAPPVDRLRGLVVVRVGADGAPAGA